MELVSHLAYAKHTHQSRLETSSMARHHCDQYTQCRVGSGRPGVKSGALFYAVGETMGVSGAKYQMRR
jgi:hypothetical protein